MVEKSIGELLKEYPYIKVYLDDFEIDFTPEKSFDDNMNLQSDDFFLQRKMSKSEVVNEFDEYLSNIINAVNYKVSDIESIEILPGYDKSKKGEMFSPIVIKKGEMVSIVGETGSGKSRLLEDIEWQADGDTPTQRRVLINGKTKSKLKKTGEQQRLIAQLSQNMNFVLDMNVKDFLRMHAECFTGCENVDELINKVYETAIKLSGEGFSMETSVTSLSGGQSRALMIADCAFLSQAPIVLIDEIENAGIDRRKAMELLSGADKIVFIATHDPVLSLLADKRILIKNGGIAKVMNKRKEEEQALIYAEKLDNELLSLRNKIRRGEQIYS